MNRKSISALVAILLAAIVGAYSCSMMSTGSFKLGDVETVGSFTVEADRIVIYGGPPSMLLRIASAADDPPTPIAFANQCKVEIINMVLTKVEGDRILEIKADRVTGKWVAMNMTSLNADNATFNGLTMVDIPRFEQRATGNVTLLGNVVIHSVYLFAQEQVLYKMELNVKSA